MSDSIYHITLIEKEMSLKRPLSLLDRANIIRPDECFGSIGEK